MLPMVIMRRTPAPRNASARRALGMSAALLCSLALVAPVSAHPGADPDPSKQKKHVDAQIDKLRDDLADTNADLANAYIALRTTGLPSGAVRARGTLPPRTCGPWPRP